MGNLFDIQVSVIVPVYRIDETLLRNCIQSLIDQEIQQAEFIVVDDGSPDNCGRICDEYAIKDDRIRVFHTENAGVSHARNVGLAHARGKFITFLDGDDCLDASVLKNSVEIMENSQIDLLQFMFYSKGKTNCGNPRYGTFCELDSKQYKDFLSSVISHVEDYPGFLSGSSCGKLYRADVIKNNKILFVEGLRKCQDRVYVFDYLQKVERIGLYYYDGYDYVYNATSITNRYNPEIENILDHAAQEVEKRIKSVTSNKTQIERDFYTMMVRFYCVILALDVLNRKNKDSFREKKQRMKELAEKETYRLAFKNCCLRKVGKKNSVIAVLIRLRMYHLAAYIGKVFWG